LTKRSTHSEKFVDEINYLRLLPPDVAALFPRLLSYSTDWQAPWMQLEYYGYPNLSEVFLFEHVDPGVWERIFTHLATILTQHLGRHQRPVSSEIAIDMYAGKTERRLATMNCSPALRHLVDHGGDVEINGKLVPGLVKQWPHIQTALADVVTRVHGTIIHGDMCLPNILYDLRSRICKFIDPRGSFGTVGVFGDQRYDVAKLWHSIHGHYDFIVNDLFQIAIDGTRVSLSIRASTGHRTIEERCAKVFFQSHNGQAPLFVQRDIQLITAMLFLSMPALHDDAPARQAAMFVRGLQLINEYFEGSP
jgi:hypothetical protein